MLWKERYYKDLMKLLKRCLRIEKLQQFSITNGKEAETVREALLKETQGSLKVASI